MPSLYDYNYPYDPEPRETGIASGMMENIPGITVSAGFFAGRASRTILRGSRTRKMFGLRKFTEADLAKRIHPVFLNPFSWGRYPHVEMYSANPFAFGGEKGGPHTPFGTAQLVNSGYRKLGRVPKFLAGEEGAPLLTPGYSGILAASGKISGRMVNSEGMMALSSRQANNIARFLYQNEKVEFSTLNRILPGFGAKGGMVNVNKNTLMQAMLGSGSGTLTGHIGGFISGSMAGANGSIASELEGIVNEPFKRGFNLATKWAGETQGGVRATYNKAIEKAGEEGVEKIAKSRIMGTVLGKSAMLKFGAMAPKIASVGSGASTVAFVYQLAKMGGQLANKLVIKPALNLTRDSIHSYIGTLDKPIMGMGFRDTEATATMRQRGVMAIQNSRLNARSILGNEAGMVYSHFG